MPLGGDIDGFQPTCDAFELVGREALEKRDAGDRGDVDHSRILPRAAGQRGVARLGDGGVPERPNGTASKAVRGLIRPSRVQITPPPRSVRAGPSGPARSFVMRAAFADHPDLHPPGWK